MVVEIQTARSPRRGRQRTETDVRALVRGGDEEGAATAALGCHEAEVFGFLVAALGSGSGRPRRLRHVCERVRCEISGLRVALLAAHLDVRRLPRGAPPATPALPSGDVASPPAATELHSPTLDPTVPGHDHGAGHRRGLGDRLDVEDRSLLILSVDRGMDLPDLATHRAGRGSGLSSELRAEARRRIRGELQRIRATLEQAAVEERLPSGPGDSHEPTPSNRPPPPRLPKAGRRRTTSPAGTTSPTPPARGGPLDEQHERSSPARRRSGLPPERARVGRPWAGRTHDQGAARERRHGDGLRRLRRDPPPDDRAQGARRRRGRRHRRPGRTASCGKPASLRLHPARPRRPLRLRRGDP